MIGNLLKVIITLITGFLVGLVFGAAIGIVPGVLFSLFFQEIVFAKQTVLVSIILSMLEGGALGFFCIQVLNKVFETEDRPIAGAVMGALIGLMIAFFLYGVIYIPDPEVFNQGFYILPITYSVGVSSQIGSILYPLFGVAGVVRNIFKSYIEARKNKEQELDRKNELSFYRKPSPDE